MISTLIYRSRLSPDFDPSKLGKLVCIAQSRNAELQISGILLFDGTHFLQVLEGPLAHVNSLYAKINHDTRHDSVVELMRDYAPKRHFEVLGMTLFDLRYDSPRSVLRSVISAGALKFNLACDGRVYKFIKSFLRGSWREQYPGRSEPDRWAFVPIDLPLAQTLPFLFPDQPCQFAIQPIVEPLRGQISSFEALIRSPSGGSPQDYFASIPPDKIHEADLLSKEWAFALAKQIGIGSHKLSINLLPMSLVNIPGAVDILLAQITRHGLVPEQVIVEVTEDEVISGYDEFTIAIMQLRSAGIGLAIDDFGAGFAGLSLLTKFQPGELKIDRSIVTDIHLHGPKQAIVNAIVKCCAELEISVVAEGVEKVEEWCWLEAAGIKHFQGYLFAKPALNGVAPVCWPVRQVKV